MTYLIVFFLVSLSALFSGLTLGFFSLNKDGLERKAELGDKQAKKIMRVRKNGNLLLCTLLIGNVAVNSVLSIFLGSLASGVVAAIVATALIVIFGEIIPQAAFSRYAMIIGSKLVWLVLFFIIIFYPICWPIAWVLNKVLGEEMPTVYSKKELVKIIEEHEDMPESTIDADEEKILKGGLTFSDKTAGDIMTPRTQMVSLDAEEIFSDDRLKEIYRTGHSRLPVYRGTRDNIEGILYVKDLIAIDLEGKKIGDLCRKNIITVIDTMRLDDLLNQFKTTHRHLFVVRDEFGTVVGLVSIEDVIEEIIGAEIVDEFDVYANLQERAKQRAGNKQQ